MAFTSIAFYAFALVTVLAALGVVTVRNSVHAALLLVLTFFSTACLWLLLQAEFLGIVLVLVYVGAVMVLFLFVVMMLDINSERMREGFAHYLPVAVVVALVMFVEMIALVGLQRFEQTFAEADPAALAGGSNIQWVARALFNDYLLPFEVASVILTVAIIAAIAITLRRRPGTKHQDPARQVQVKRDDRVRLVKMAAVRKEGKTP
ncbi:MAG: NADH:ubiquinone oxidoreductase subunit J [Lysobacterales bacterium CG17_big_fil_post_rev_8_21_14_2_50_64_11]|nr:MAG: NADH:ubiquinone oxidoreductase subunit J [Xanthomonadales bacterium CG17_big_fil_post_rev_8_21_14_2_50_64_11]PIX61053.1 MAG: NADH:ubiquinone oxidoreductase subunit J [Xanthomonadales bacterium CG_4_10_14_3_um_filter_64_11]